MYTCSLFFKKIFTGKNFIVSLSNVRTQRTKNHWNMYGCNMCIWLRRSIVFSSLCSSMCMDIIYISKLLEELEVHKIFRNWKKNNDFQINCLTNSRLKTHTCDWVVIECIWISGVLHVSFLLCYESLLRNSLNLIPCGSMQQHISFYGFKCAYVYVCAVTKK